MLMYWSCACGRWRAQRFAQGFTVGPNVWFCNAGDCWELLNGDIGTWDTEPDEILSNSNSAPTPGGGKFWDDMSVALIVCIESPCGTDISARSTARSSKNPPGVPNFFSEQASSVSRSCDGVFADVIPLQLGSGIRSLVTAIVQCSGSRWCSCRRFWSCESIVSLVWLGPHIQSTMTGSIIFYDYIRLLSI
jgi:hypothetical protein